MSANRSRKPSARRAPVPARRLPLVPVVLALIVVAGVVAIVASRGSGKGSDTTPGIQEVRPVSVVGDALPLHAEGTDAAVGTAAPELRGAGFDGAPVNIVSDQRPKVIVFVAHWCPHCQREVPRLTGWLAGDGMPSDVDVYAVSTATSADNPNYPPSEWLAREQFNVPTLADNADGAAANAFGLSAFPFFVALDADSRVAARGSGELTQGEWESLVAQARRGVGENAP